MAGMGGRGYLRRHTLVITPGLDPGAYQSPDESYEVDGWPGRSPAMTMVGLAMPLLHSKRKVPPFGGTFLLSLNSGPN
jgi:hypothetical protein